jgi:hypothetical protein
LFWPQADLREFITRLMRVSLLVVASSSIAAHAQDPLKTLPNNYKLAFENSSVEVIRAHYGPHEKIPIHDHTSYATVFVYLSDSGQVRIDHAEDGDKVSSVVRPPTVKGSYRVAPGMKERHSIENLGDTSSDFLRIELKNVTFHISEPFRGKAPQTLSSDLDNIEFSDPELEIERIVCAGDSACAIKPSPSPSLIVAFSPLLMTFQGSQNSERIDEGSVRWMPPGQLALLAPGSPATHLLRILLPEASK